MPRCWASYQGLLWGNAFEAILTLGNWTCWSVWICSISFLQNIHWSPVFPAILSDTVSRISNLFYFLGRPLVPAQLSGSACTSAPGFHLSKSDYHLDPQLGTSVQRKEAALRPSSIRWVGIWLWGRIILHSSKGWWFPAEKWNYGPFMVGSFSHLCMISSLKRVPFSILDLG